MKKGWPCVRLGEVIAQRTESVQIDDTQTYRRCRVQLGARGIVLRDELEGAFIKTKRQQVCRASELLVAEIDAKVGGYGIVPIELEGAIVSSHYFLFEVDKSKLDPNFLGYFVRTPVFGDQVVARGSTNYASVRSQQILEYTIPLPPLQEQRRIVARIEALAAKIEEAKGLREGADRLTQALFAESGEVAFQKASCRRLQIGELAEVKGGIQKSPLRTPQDHPVRYLTVAHVLRNRILLDDPRYFEVPPAELKARRLLSGDVLIIEGNGSADQIGRTALFRGEIDPCVHQNHVIRIRPDQSFILPEYLNAYLNSAAGQSEVQRRSRTTSGLRSLSVGRIKRIEIPTPAFMEQRRIVAYLGSLQAKVDRLKALQAQSASELEALLPAVLEKALRGES